MYKNLETKRLETWSFIVDDKGNDAEYLMNWKNIVHHKLLKSEQAIISTFYCQQRMRKNQVKKKGQN